MAGTAHPTKIGEGEMGTGADATGLPDHGPGGDAGDKYSVPDADAEKYRRLEDLIFKMADFEATSNPRRAALLRQAYKQSKDRLTQSQLAAIVALLSQKQYKRALDGQEIARKDLQELLQLLLSMQLIQGAYAEDALESQRLQAQRELHGRRQGRTPRSMAWTSWAVIWLRI